MSDQTRNLRPHAEARLAMGLYGHEYAHEQRGGSMDFWDSLHPSRRRVVKSILNSTLAALDDQGRAPSSDYEQM